MLGDKPHQGQDRDTGKDTIDADFPAMAARVGATSGPNTAIDVEVDSPGNKRPCPSPSSPEATRLTLELFQSII